MRLRRTAVVLACTAALTACGTSVPVAVLPTTASSSTTSAPGTTTAPSPTFTRPDVIPPIDSITATGDPGRILGDTAGSYPGRLEVTGTDPRTIHRQVRAGMLTEFKRILDGAGMHFTRSQVWYGQRQVRGRTMMRLDYFAWVSPCGDGVKKALGTPLTKLGYAIADAKDGWISGRRGDVGLAAGPSEVPDIYCELLLATPYIDAALDPGQFPDSFENELNGGPTIEYPPPTAAVL